MTLAIKNKQIYFELSPGGLIDLEIKNPVKLRIKTRLVGYELGSYIILKHPDPQHMSSYQDVFSKGNVVIARYILEGDKGQCFAFASTILHVTNVPKKFIFLSYPQKIENRELRSHQRVATHFPASILAINDNEKKPENAIKGVIGDISAKGCGFIFKTDNEKLKVNKMQVFVVFETPDAKSINIAAKVCNSRFEAGKINVGIKFEDTKEKIQNLLEYLFIEIN